MTKRHEIGCERNASKGSIVYRLFITGFRGMKEGRLGEGRGRREGERGRKKEKGER